jgi:hypothetical protein
VAITRKVVRSNRMAWSRCRLRQTSSGTCTGRPALGMMVCTILNLPALVSPDTRGRGGERERARDARETKRRRMAYLATASRRGCPYQTPRQARLHSPSTSTARATGAPVALPCDEIHHANEKYGRRGRILLQRVDAIAVVRGVLGRVVCADLENVDQHADVLDDHRGLGGQVRVS